MLASSRFLRSSSSELYIVHGWSIYRIEKKEHNGNLLPYLERICDYSNDTIDIALEKINDILSNENVTENTYINVVGDCVDNYSDLFVNKLRTRLFMMKSLI